MELPDDVLLLIRAYAKPAFKHFREYNRALHVLKRYQWKELKDKLRTHGDALVPTLLLYLDARIEVQKAKDKHVLYWLRGRGPIPEDGDVDELKEKIGLSKSIYRKLHVLLYDERLMECDLYGYD